MSEEITIGIPEAVYSLLNTQYDGMPCVLVVNSALCDFAHRDVFPWHLHVTLDAEGPTDNGMPAREESDLLFRIGDEIEASVLGVRTPHGATNALFLARSTWNGLRELRFMVHDPEIAHADLQGLLHSKQWARQWEYRMAADAEWAQGQVLLDLFTQASEANAHDDRE